MKVLILSNHFNIGGITSYILNLSRGLNELGVKVYIASSGGDALNKLDCEHIKLPLRTKFELSPKIYLSYLKLRSLIREIDIIHANTRITRILAYKLSSDHRPYISTVHGYHKPRIKNLLFPYWGKMIIAVSNFVKKHLVSEFKVSTEKIRVIYNGIDINYFKDFKTDVESLKMAYGFKDKFLILTISRLSDVKGFQYLLKAFKLFLQKFPEAILLITGAGKEERKIKKSIKMLSLTQNVRLLGVVKDIRPMLKMADVFLQPSLIEGLGISILEALAMAKPIIATDTGGIPEIITDGYNGILVKPQDPYALAQALVMLRKGEKQREVLSTQAKINLGKFYYKHMAENTYQLYHELVNENY